MKTLIIIISIVLAVDFNFAEVKVVATTTSIYDLVKEVGGDKVKVDYLCRGDQDPHFLEVMPSYMLKLRNADLVMEIGLDIEKWLPQLIDGSRNTDLKLIDLSANIEKKEVPTTKPDASQGDVHPYGNPHYWLDPENVKIMANEISDALTNASPGDASYFKKNLDDYLSTLDKKITRWKKEMEKLKGKPVVTFHSSWIYFADRFGLKVVGHVEPKPGIPPTPSHNAELIQTIKNSGAKIILMENYYSDNAPNQISGLTGATVIKVPVEPFGINSVNSYIQMMDYIIDQLVKNT
jgi:zinc/manganese transport system substrate-binding protein